MVLPKETETIGGTTDLLDLYQTKIENIRNDTLYWFVLWSIGALFGGLAIMK